MSTMQDELNTAELINYLRRALSLHQKNALTPLQRACWLGNKKKLHQLIQTQLERRKPSQHEDINLAIYLAVVRGNAGILSMLIQMGGFDGARCIQKAKHLACIIENFECIEVLQNYVSPKFMLSYTKPLHNSTRLLPFGKLTAIQKFFMDVNMHPVYVCLNLERYDLINIIKPLKKAFELQMVLEMSKTTNRNEFIGIKSYFFALLLSDIKTCSRPLTDEGPTQHSLVHHFVRFVYEKDFDGKSYIQYFVSDFVHCFPFQDSTLLGQIKVKLCELTNTVPPLWILRNTLNGGSLKARDPTKLCSCCENDNIKLKCTKCNAVQYCGKSCEIYHKFMHEKTCKFENDDIKKIKAIPKAEAGGQ